MQSLNRTFSFKKQLISMLLLFAIIPVFIFGSISLFSQSALISNKVEKGIQDSLEQSCQGLEDAFENLEFVSLQLSNVGIVGRSMFIYLQSNSQYSKAEAKIVIRDGISLISYTNPSIGFICYYFSNEKGTLFENNIIDQEVDFANLPVFFDYKDFTFFGIHRSLIKNNNDKVISIIRKAYMSGLENLSIYIETDSKFIFSLLNSEKYGMPASTILLDDQGKVIYSDDETAIPLNTYLNLEDASNGPISNRDYYLFQNTGSRGWSMVVAIKKSEFYKETYNMIFQYSIAIFILLAISFLFSWLICRMVYRPLSMLTHEVQLMTDSQFSSPIEYTKIEEFDGLLQEFQTMRQKIKELFVELEQNERLKARLEVEKLLFQINPHFLHNTLNTVQWIARMNGQKEIDTLLSALTRLLYYNMGKEGSFISVKEEVESLNDYVTLQLARNDHQFEIIFDVADQVKGYLIPRFIIQPLVENSIYHGLVLKEGVISIEITHTDNQHININVQDNGVGMSENIIKKLEANDTSDEKELGIGIGLSYVVRILKAYYGTNGHISIKSVINIGTTVSIDIPDSCDRGDVLL